MLFNAKKNNELNIFSRCGIRYSVEMFSWAFQQDLMSYFVKTYFNYSINKRVFEKHNNLFKKPAIMLH